MKTNMELGTHLDALLAAGTGIAASVTAYIQGKRNAKSTELDNVAKAIQIWQDTATELKSELEKVETEQRLLKKNHELCEESKKRLEFKVDILTKKMQKFEGE